MSTYQSVLTPEKLNELVEDTPEFVLVLMESISNSNFVNKFAELAKMTVPRELTTIEKMIDKATGYKENHDEFCLAFISFVYEFIWLTLPKDAHFEIKKSYDSFIAS